jgi:hypothetical protein
MGMLIAGSNRRLALGLGAGLSLGTLLALTAGPVLADASLGNWTAVSGDSYSINTSSLTLTGPGTSYLGQDDSGIATFTFGTVDIPSGATVAVTGTLPLEIVAQDSFTLGGTLAGNGISADWWGGTVVATSGGPGGGAGGTGGSSPGAGPGGGGVAGGGTTPEEYNGAGGGGFGGTGAAGGVYGAAGTAGSGGPSYGDLLTQLEGGSGGASASPSGPVSGGGGGGGIEIDSPTGTITLSSGSVLSANGGNGALGGNGASGGGSGGGILLEAHTITSDGAVSADGGDGGAGGCCGGGGAGGGGRVVELYNSASGSGTATASGGTSYLISYGSMTGTSTGASEPDPTGDAGQVLLESPSTSTSVTETPASPTVGETATLGASVTASAGPSPSGSVVFSDSSGTLCTATLTAGSTESTGSCRYRVSKSGADQVTATFDPTGPDASGTAAATVSATVPIPTTGASSGEFALPLGGAALLLGILLLSVAGIVGRRRQSV